MNSSSASSVQIDEVEGTISWDSTRRQRKPLGWKTMPYIIGNETLERLATFGLMANFMVYMVREYHMDQVQAATLINTWSALTNFAPIIGAFISYSYTGKFNTIAFGSTAEILGMSVLTVTSIIPSLRPPPCTTDKITGQKCIQYSDLQLYVLLLGLFLLSVGTGGIRSCSIPFSLDQFDNTTEEGREGSRSFFSWYYTTHTTVQLISMTLVLYVQNNISWSIGFSIPTVLNMLALLLLFVGTRLYVFVKPEGSVFSGIFKVLVAAYKNRNVRSSSEIDSHQPLLETDLMQSNKVVLTDRFRCLNKAAVVMNNDEAGNNEWRMNRVRQIEDIKSIISIIPIFASSIIGFLAMNQQQTFTVSQALKMNLQFPGTSYLIPPASITVISLLTIGVWLPFYETVLVRHIENITKQGDFSLLQKVGIGNFFSISTMFISGIVERKRRDFSLNGVNISVFWLSPQQVLMGFYQVFTVVGLTEFFNKQVPINMRSIGNSLLYLGMSLASYLSSAMVSLVHSLTARGETQSWLTDDINLGKLDYFYYFIAVVTTLNFIFFLVCARKYHYRNM